MFRVGMWGLAALMTALVLSGCANKGRLAPFDDHSIGAARSSNRVLPGAENAGKPGYYTVKPGDTLIRIGMDHGQSGRDIARWNKLDNPNLIEAGQVLRVVPPAPEAPLARASASTGSAAAPMPVASAPAAAAPIPAPSAAEDAISFQWPARGNLISGFDESKNKGLDIGGKAGDPVLAAADGRVVYAGAGLRGYGNLIILKHNNTYLTAYAHNQALLVKEDQVIKRGQKIAEMGSSDADQVKLHFEIRRQGKPVDPAKYLSAN
ncbi:MAG: peptidase [Burkholderiales bacterium 35-55-47]|uniref:peptidoglycan DD-metalloendopeptidase family protein n=1 Tax=Limnohabitans sp. TaxID=1907725 RepID=UPI000BD92F8B|nr:peptidoglycan DD-metalloendopeptidase family protein [Limnohabitans sp.]OYY19841.1 MAG: peptidase [Burkholderiales bacterium 35-55-47]OYZ74548.1 MAG: peptidase [Burkholderiales bacterium 24-55-52]OZB01562.1 MAG: peptidase [Burkholderiales bacterium 39-55-53]HQR86049.1 peptidoglycan DD-metalloendopeptidase family protein [Limnohabitans sp.]HQS26035.1 peptidoglycan DD-metalloendopeptidase family protein [Limnohabitans sp.]